MWTETYLVKSRLCESIEKSDDAVQIVDIGGGAGHVLKDFVKDPSHQTGLLILQGLPAVIGDAEALKQQGIEGMAYDFFTPQPVKGEKVIHKSACNSYEDFQEPKLITFAVSYITGPIVLVLRF